MISFKPELDPNRIGYMSITVRKFLSNAVLFGAAVVVNMALLSFMISVFRT